MDSSDAASDKRPFQPLLVGACYAQVADDRFGKGASDAVRERERATTHFLSLPDEASFAWLESGSETDGDSAETSIYRLVPTMQRFRNNLTALSQVYNLYLVAYQGQIFVYVPRGILRQTIPQHPDLRLVPPRSAASRDIGGYQDPVNPHTINHIAVGALGREEVVVACYDDGDVVSYMTRELADLIASKPARTARVAHKKAFSGPRNKTPKPFLHENVGKSAWGIAIHKKSRLIAVSSNRREVTVFALALTPSKKGPQAPDTCEHCHESCDDIESHVRQRARNWRIIVTLGRLADNIPNLCFIDDESGSAELICAVDIKGVTWLADIWKPWRPATRIDPPSSQCWPGLPRDWDYRGWGILALPRTSFVGVESVEELIGGVDRGIDPLSCWRLNVESCLHDIPDNPCAGQMDLSLPLHLPLAFGEGVIEAPGAATALGDQTFSADGSQDSDLDVSSHDGEDMEDEADIDGDEETLHSAAMAVIENSIAAAQGSQLMPDPVQQLLIQALPAAGALQTLAAAPNGGVVLPNFTLTGDAAASAPQKGVEASLGRQARGRIAASPKLDMAYFPQQGVMFPVPREKSRLLAFLRSESPSNAKRTGDVSGREKLAKRYHVLRLLEREVELRSLDVGDEGPRREFGILCPEAMDMGQRAMSPTTRLLFRATSRLNMVAHVPELSLVVVGSPVGRVLLVTPTRLARPVEREEQGLLQHGFRVDWVLPRRSDEARHRRPLRPLHGMAIGPVQEGETAPAGGRGAAPGEATMAGGGGEGGARRRPRRYRLMLHYRNHDVLTYEITRQEETRKLCIF